MGLRNDRSRYYLADATSFEALQFLERSRDVADEVVVDCVRRETATSPPEESATESSTWLRPDYSTSL
jgi:hypothetical protein